MSLRQLLESLSDGCFHSGSDLGRALGMSRTAVWKQLQKLTELGVELYSVRGRGYRIPDGLSLLNEDVIQGLLQPETSAQLSELLCELNVDSTNAVLMRRAAVGDCGGVLLAAEQQTAGRGRRGRHWISPFGRNLYFSLGWHFAGGAGSLEGLSLLVGLAVRQGLADCGIDDIQLKWPNDLLRPSGKLAGILIELQGDATGPCQVVIGVGVNVAMPSVDARQIDQPWADCALGDVVVDRNYLLASILNRLVPALARFGAEGFAPFQAEWNGANAHADQVVYLQTPQHHWEGVCRGVDAAGALLLERDGSLEAFHGGEVSLRVAHDA